MKFSISEDKSIGEVIDFVIGYYGFSQAQAKLRTKKNFRDIPDCLKQVYERLGALLECSSDEGEAYLPFRPGANDLGFCYGLGGCFTSDSQGGGGMYLSREVPGNTMFIDDEIYESEKIEPFLIKLLLEDLDYWHRWSITFPQNFSALDQLKDEAKICWPMGNPNKKNYFMMFDDWAMLYQGQGREPFISTFTKVPKRFESLSGWDRATVKEVYEKKKLDKWEKKVLKRAKKY